MAGKAAQGFSHEIPKKTEAAVRTQMEHPIRPENHQAEPSDTSCINYFSIGSMKSVMAKIDQRLRTMIRVIIWKQWKKPSKRLWGLKKLGVPAKIAERESQWGDHYQFIATKSSLGRAVSKQVLSRKGLVSCLDYYLERHDLKFS